MGRYGKKYELQEKPICNAVAVFRERGNYLQRLEQFEKAIQAYNEALRWNPTDVLSLLGRSLARAKATHYAGALEDAARAAELEPENPTALQIKAQTEYQKCAFERALMLAHRGGLIRRYPPDFADCARVAEETVRDCIVGKTSRKVLEAAATLSRKANNKTEQEMGPINIHSKHKCRMQTQQTQYHEVEEVSRTEKQRAKQIYCLMSSKYLERMAHDKHFLTALCNDERLTSANKQGSKKLLELANKALADIENRQTVLRERCPLYAARATETAAKARLLKTRKEQIKRTQMQHIADAQRLIGATKAAYAKKDTAKCLEAAEFAMERISRKLNSLLPGKEKFLQQLYDTVADAFLDQKRVKEAMSESDREKRAYILLGMALSREPSRDSVLRVRSSAPRNSKRRLRTLERYLALSTRTSERCYLLHELARLHVEIKQPLRARYYAFKCQSEARAVNHRTWLLNASFLLARCNLLQNNRPEARAVLLEGTGLAKSFGFDDVSAFFDTCVDVSLEGEVLNEEAALEKRERDMVGLMQDDDMKSAAENLFQRMSVLPANRRFSILPGMKVEETAGPVSKRRASIMPNMNKPTRISRKKQQPLGLQDFDI